LVKRPLTITQAIIYKNKAWRQVSQSTIVNCWRKADILDNLDYDFEKYLNCDNDVQTCVDLTDEEIVSFCMKKKSGDIEAELEEYYVKFTLSRINFKKS
jgi:hypothetical protein